MSQEDQDQDQEYNNNEEQQQELIPPSINFDQYEEERQRVEKELGISQKITASEREITSKNWEHVQELGGLEVDGNLLCDLENHDNEKILMVCANNFCDAPRRLCCGYCNPLHSTHLNSLRKLQTFRDTALHSRVELQNTLAEFTQFENKALVQGLLVNLIKQKQKQMLNQFLKFQAQQYNTLIKLLDGATENYLFEEMGILKTVGNFHSKIDTIFGKDWHDLKKDDIMALIRLHENFEEYVGPIRQLGSSREKLSKDLTGLINEIFGEQENNLRQLELQSEDLMQQTLDKVYSESNQAKTLKVESSQIVNNNSIGSQSSRVQNQGSQIEGANNPLRQQTANTSEVIPKTATPKEFHSILLKDGNAPKTGWKSIQILPKWAQYLQHVEACNKKYGQFKRSSKDLPNSMDFTIIGPLEDIRGDIYIGQWRQGLRWGYGKMIQKDGTFYEGTWQKSKMEGIGRKVFRNGNMYEGEFMDDKMNGKGKFYHTGGSQYEGEWKDDMPHGRGKEYMINKDVFEGEFKKGLKEGKGALTGADGSLITGIWKEGKIDGKGEQRYADGRVYKGDFKDDKKEGEGSLTWPDSRRYEGPWSKGKQHGIGYFYNPDGTKNRGEWINGNRIRWINTVNEQIPPNK